MFPSQRPRLITQSKLDIYGSCGQTYNRRELDEWYHCSVPISGLCLQSGATFDFFYFGCFLTGQGKTKKSDDTSAPQYGMDIMLMVESTADALL